MTCGAHQVGDQMMCSCGLAWDVEDPDPPKCRPVPERRLTADRRAGVLAALPAELPEDVARHMAAAYELMTPHTANPAQAMRAAYRVLLDRIGR